MADRKGASKRKDQEMAAHIKDVRRTGGICCYLLQAHRERKVSRGPLRRPRSRSTVKGL
jgi:hypothetical protein